MTKFDRLMKAMDRLHAVRDVWYDLASAPRGVQDVLEKHIARLEREYEEAASAYKQASWDRI